MKAETRERVAILGVKSNRYLCMDTAGNPFSSVSSSFINVMVFIKMQTLLLLFIGGIFSNQTMIFTVRKSAFYARVTDYTGCIFFLISF